MAKKHTQVDDIIETMQKNGGYATLAHLNQNVDTSSWKTKTPFESIRCYLQRSDEFFKIQPGLWALTNYRESVLKKFQIKENEKEQIETFTHSYYQGLIVDIGNMKNLKTYVPAQDKNKLFLDKKLGQISTMTDIPKFTYPKITNRAKTIDTIWFNEREMPTAFYEVEHSTNIINSLNKFFELQDFRARFCIVADKKRKNEFDDKISQSIYRPIKSLVDFVDYEMLANQHSKMAELFKNTLVL
ncbi:hypothetical protein [Treponema denticola]|uniref:HTH HARE-type domain-containing protein n=1 Tax=Treponema denticola SP33 TaxID=999437 RepID=M2BUD9_TREDN|nr:hypothetical protein [Treponema denticola]EMB25664.1 hypothetical protein HMPREF9733_00796 [Treponema denticola SP33]EPF37076.1 hypothetical protein HMPREF9732_01105 [Treponema denticola SP32]